MTTEKLGENPDGIAGYRAQSERPFLIAIVRKTLSGATPRKLHEVEILAGCLFSPTGKTKRVLTLSADGVCEVYPAGHQKGDPPMPT